MFGNIVLALSIIFWIFPAIRNRSGEYKYLFLALALADPLIIISMLLKAPWDQNYGVLFNGSIMFLFVKKSRIKLKVVLNKLAFLLVVFFGGVYYQVIIQYQNFLVDLLTVTEILMVLLYEILKKRKINFFTWALLFYLILNLLNPILILFNKEYGTHYFYLTVIVMMFFALFFSMFTDTSKMLIINLKSGRNSYGN